MTIKANIAHDCSVPRASLSLRFADVAYDVVYISAAASKPAGKHPTLRRDVAFS